MRNRLIRMDIHLFEKTLRRLIPTWARHSFGQITEPAGQVLEVDLSLHSKVNFLTVNRTLALSNDRPDPRYKPASLRREATLEKLYETAFIEGEGIGTAYEYFAKWRLLEKLFQFKIENVLILGLPEKYGTSMDFVLLGDQHGCNITVVDERSRNVDKCRNILDSLRKRELLSKYPKVIEVDDLPHFHNAGSFDLVLCSEVLQRLPEGERQDYVRNALHIARYAAMFMPNKENISHAKISKLEALGLEELLNLFVGYAILEKGYIDMPPFPPGLKIAKRTRANGAHQTFKDRILIEMLEQWSKIEGFSDGLKRRNSHIVFVIATAHSADLQ